MSIPPAEKKEGAVRIDLARPEDTCTKLVACEMPEHLSSVFDSLIVAERSGVQIRETIADAFFDQVGLKGCILLNR